MRKKVGILTFHNSVNYGAVMQAYGLQEYLTSQGYKVDVIDYVNSKIESELTAKLSYRLSSPASIVKYIIKNFYRSKKRQQFNSFNEKYLHLSISRDIHDNEINKIADMYDFLITGSDQVWNLKLTGNDLVYFLNFAKEKTKRIAYAVSVGDVNSVDLGIAMKEINRFSAVSVREKSFLDYALANYKIPVVLCADPTILAGRQVFENICSNKCIRKKYIFCFLMENKPGIINVAHKIAKEKGYVVIDNKSSVDFFLHSNPVDFLSWIRHAEIVFTDSFHATVFSVLFCKQFVSDKYDSNKKLKSRVNDLLFTIGLDNQIQDISLENYDSIIKILYTTINYDTVLDKMDVFSNDSRNWLKKAIEESV